MLVAWMENWIQSMVVFLNIQQAEKIPRIKTASY